jgi:hypothetical protein
MEDHSLVMRVEEPATGLMDLFAFDFKGPVLVFVRGYFYGEAGAEAVAREEQVWREWLVERLPGALAGSRRRRAAEAPAGHAAP